MKTKVKAVLSVPLIALVIACGALLTASPQAGAQMAKSTIEIDGSTTVGPIAKAFAQYYMDAHPDVSITISETGSGDGARSMIAGRCDIANMSRPMKAKEFKEAVENGSMPVAHVVAMDGIAMVVHPSNPVGELSVEQIHDIYTGRISNWSQLGGPNMPVVKISRDSSSGTYETFEKLVMGDDEIKGAEYVQHNGQAHDRVATTRAAIGYVGLGFVDREVKAVTVNGVEANPRTVASGTYPIARPLFMYTDGYPQLGSPVHQFVTLHLSRDGQTIVQEIGFVPVTDY